MPLCKVIKINQTKCLNCHSCIYVCPVKYCITDNSTVNINDDLCIGCGRCYHACPHGAITYVDDFKEFIESINMGKKLVLIISPAIITAFPDKYRNLISWFKNYFVLNGVFDEGLGAELASILYMDSLKNNKQIPIISQQCPSIINYIKIYHRNLIKYLAPFQSPALILARIIKKVYNFNGAIAYLGPCISKKREFTDSNTHNLIQYNITIENLIKYIEANNINITKYKVEDFDYIPSERGSTFCKPGGLINTIKRFYKNPSMLNIEGKIIYETYLKDLENDINKFSKHLPLIIDILNCRGGCIHGPATINKLTLNEEIWHIEDKEEESMQLYVNELKAHKVFENILNENNDINFGRKYLSESANPLYTIEYHDLKEQFKKLNKTEKKDFLNCQSCGFKTCMEFATSFNYKLNDPKNCRVYLENNNVKIIHSSNVILEEISVISNKMVETSKFLLKIIDQFKSTFSNVNNNVKNIINYNEQLVENSVKFDPIISAITDVAEQINLLSFNASIEASRTGDIGKGFSVVASEIRNLADKTRVEIDKIPSIMQIISNNSILIRNNINNIDNLTSEYNHSIEIFNESIKKIDLLINDLLKTSKNK